MQEQFGIRVYKEYFNFGAAHFLIFGDGSREELHGHNYRVRVDAWGEPTDAGLVVDFIKFKPVVKRICDELDHRMLLPRFNPRLTVTEHDDRVEARYEDGSYFCFPRKDVRVMELRNTSTELLAQYICLEILTRLPQVIADAKVSTLQVEVEESPGQCGVYRRTL